MYFKETVKEDFPAKLFIFMLEYYCVLQHNANTHTEKKVYLMFQKDSCTLQVITGTE